MFGGIAAKAAGNDAPRWRWPTLASRWVWLVPTSRSRPLTWHSPAMTCDVA
jgi:hypothetical protein